MDFIFSIKNHYFEKGTPWVENECKGEVVLVCDCGERFYNAQDFFDDHRFINLCHVVIKGAVYEN